MKLRAVTNIMKEKKKRTNVAAEPKSADSNQLPEAVVENLQSFHDAITSIENEMEKVFEIPLEERQAEVPSEYNIFKHL